MKILHLIPYVPVPPDFGGALRVYHLLRGMTQRHDVSLITYGSGSDRETLQRHFPRLRSIVLLPQPWERRYKRLAQLVSTFSGSSFFSMSCVTDTFQRAINETVSREEFDIVQTEFSHFAQYDIPTSALKIVDAHNVEYDNFRRMWANAPGWSLRNLHYRLETLKLRTEEIGGCRRQDAIMVTSERDGSMFADQLPDKPTAVIPNGVDASYFTASEEHREPATIVFTGMMGYVPNYDGMLYFLDEIFPRILRRIPEARIVIVGKNPPSQLQSRASSNIVVTGYVDDVRPYIRRASVYVVPLRMGSGTRLKIAEALAMHVPLVTTRIGCEGIEIRHGETGLVADDPAEFAENVIRILLTPSLGRKLTESGYALMKEKYEWSVISRKLDEWYDTLLAERKAELVA